ncbi:MAG: PrgI family protein [Candidatus Nanosynbacter sp.]|nr:PrgI family protein [Candidatus Nanosynbacter sp.]
MATYKVPQDVEAEDKLLGPFTFRQFIYLLISAAGIAIIFGLFQIFPLLAIIPIPFTFFFLILALPIKKDQPMEVYLASIASFYLKPNTRRWTPGQKETTIKITAPKIVEKPRARNITEEEASTRLSFLSNLVDSEGYAIRGNSNFNEDFIAENNNIVDILDQDSNQNINQMIAKEQQNRHAALISNMKAAISNADQNLPPTFTQNNTQTQFTTQPQYVNGFINQTSAAQVNQGLQNLANNQDFTIDTISKQANRLTQSAQTVQTAQVAQPPQPQVFTQPQQSQAFTQSPQPQAFTQPSQSQPQFTQPQFTQPQPQFQPQFQQPPSPYQFQQPYQPQFTPPTPPTPPASSDNFTGIFTPPAS